MCSWRCGLLRGTSFQRSALVLWDLRWGQDEVSVTDRGRLLFADAGFQHVNVVTGGHRRSLCFACASYRDFSYALLSWVQHPASNRADAEHLLCPWRCRLAIIISR